MPSLSAGKLLGTLADKLLRPGALIKIACIYLTLALGACESEPTDQSPTLTPSQQIPGNTDLPNTIDLTDDSLIPPELVSLEITAEIGLLKLQWETIENQISARLFELDLVNGGEVLVSESFDSSLSTISLVSNTHRRSWHSEQFRVELCNVNDCISSERVGISGLVEATAQRITPAVFSSIENFADSIAVNENASLMVAALPVEGIVEFYIRPENRWISTQQLRLDLATLSTTREVFLDSSASGDTVAALLIDDNQANTVPTISISLLERFGEAWIELSTPELVIPATTTGDMNETDEVPTAIHLSSDGDRLLISHQSRLYASSRSLSGWTPLNLLNGSTDTQTLSEASSNATVALRTIEAVATDTNLQTIYTIETDNQSRWLSTWKAQDSSNDTNWTQKASVELSGFAQNRDIEMQSNSDGSRLAIAGWEPATAGADTPIMWRYDIHGTDSDTAGYEFSINSIDSIRFPSTDAIGARLRFSADQSLSNVAMGWQSLIDAESAADSAMISYQFNPSISRWTPKLELPADFPTLAKQAFLRDLTLSPDGSTLLLTVEPGQSPGVNNRVGELIAFQ